MTIKDTMSHKVHPSHEKGEHFTAITDLNRSKMAAVLKNGQHLQIEVTNGKCKWKNSV